MWLSILVTILGYGGMFGAFTYIAFTLTDVSGFAASTVPWLLIVFGVGLFAGNTFGGKAADRNVDRTLVVVLSVLVVVLVGFALTAGYRSIDTAAIYGNEAGTGRAIAESGIDREELFITSKLWVADLGYDSTLAAFEASLDKLGLEHLDLYLIHWPAPATGLYLESWRALEHLLASGKARAIGVSNFLPEHLQKVIDLGGTVPAVVEIAARHGVSPAQAILRWHLQRGRIIIPKSVTPQRIRENLDVFGFDLTADELTVIDGLERDGRTGPHPAEFNG